MWKISILSQENNVFSLTQVLLKNQNTDKRIWAACRLGEIKNKLAIESLIQALQDKSTEVAGRAAASIVRMADISLKPVRHELHQIANKNRAQLDYLYALPGYIGVSFRVCGLAVADYGYLDKDFLEFIEVAPSAITELVHWQQQGYSLITPVVMTKNILLKKFAENIGSLKLPSLELECKRYKLACTSGFGLYFLVFIFFSLWP